MSSLTQTGRVIEVLKNNPGQRFTARLLAEMIVESFPEDYADKRRNPRFESDKDFFTQVAAEIGAQKGQITRSDKHVFWQDKPRPRVYWYDPSKECDQIEEDDSFDDDTGEDVEVSSSSILREEDLYPILISYLKTEHSLFCQRINEKRSGNRRGMGGNQWLHPDIVAMQPIDREWDELIRNCVSKGAGQSVRLWSFEVKKELNVSNVRKSYFQAVSNSSWANEGYLVAVSLVNSEVELRMLSALHGIGVILLNTENPSESEILLPARARAEVDWQSVNRIVTENSDFKDYIELVSTYYQTGRVRPRDWNRT